MKGDNNENLKEQQMASDGESEYAYKTVIKDSSKDKRNRRTWSVVSFALAILSVLLFYFSWVGLIFGIASIGFAVWSRCNIGYFDKLSLVGLIAGIFGVVFAVSGLFFGDIFTSFMV